MKWLISLCASACVVGCAVDPSNLVSERGADEVTDERTEANPNSELAPALEVRPTDSPERIREVARLASAAACHGTHVCTVGTPIADAFTVECGSPVCSTTGCGVGGPQNRVRKVQPAESVQTFWVAGNPEPCFEYHPARARDLNTCCFIDL